MLLPYGSAYFGGPHSWTRFASLTRFASSNQGFARNEAIQ